MKIKYLLVFVVLAVLIPAAVYAMETQTYQGTSTSSSPFLVPITTQRDGDIVANAQFPVKNHGMYVLRIWDAQDNWICYKVLDARWGRASTGDITCSAAGWSGNVPAAGNYLVEFYATMGGKTHVTLSITAETD